MSASQAETPILLLERSQADGQPSALANRVRQLGLEPRIASSFEEAQLLLVERRRIVSAALLSTDFVARGLHGALNRMHAVGPSSGVEFIAVGAIPDRRKRWLLRWAGVHLALWHPFDDATLRFQLNRAIHRDCNETRRTRPRIPTRLPARILVGERAKDASVYSLSASGAFLETPRASMTGTEVRVEIRLPHQTVMAPARVAFSNAPGNLQRPNLPLGVGIAFGDVSPQAARVLDAFVETGLRALAV